MEHSHNQQKVGSGLAKMGRDSAPVTWHWDIIPLKEIVPARNFHLEGFPLVMLSTQGGIPKEIQRPMVKIMMLSLIFSC